MPRLVIAFMTLLAIALLAGNSQASNARAADIDALIKADLDHARAQGCGPAANSLAQILCSGTLRIGVRTDYKSFATFSHGKFSGFEIDLAQVIAARLGVRPEFVPVTPANRVQRLAQGDIDIILATMGDTVSRGRQIAFVRPHYYAGPTAVVGPRTLKLSNLKDIAGRTVCVTIGNFSNQVLSQNHARLMIFDGPDRLMDALRLNVCSLIAQDQALLTANVTGAEADPAMAARFEQKFAFDPIPWGIGVPKTGSADLKRTLGLIIADLHRSGRLIAMAQTHHLDEEFLEQQHRLWSNPNCEAADGSFATACLIPPVNLEEKATAIAPAVHALEALMNRKLGWSLSFPMLEGQDSMRLFLTGIGNSLILVAGSIIATLGIALLLQHGLRSGAAPLRLPVWGFVKILHCSPVILLLVLGYLLVTLLLPFSTPVALVTAIMVIGLSNGSFAASAITEAADSLDAGTRLAVILRLASPQIIAFVVNAARASAIASFIGVPELLTTLTDITSFTSERRTTYTMLLIFYMAVVMGVVAICRVVTRRLDTQTAATS